MTNFFAPSNTPNTESRVAMIARPSTAIRAVERLASRLYEDLESDPYLDLYYYVAFLSAVGSGYFMTWVMYG